MDFGIKNDGQIVIAEINGRIDGTTVDEFEGAVTSAIPDENRDVICDFSGVTYVSSAGLRAILIIAKRFSKQSTMFSICGLSEPVAEVFRISGFNKIIRIYKSREDALAAANT